MPSSFWRISELDDEGDGGPGLVVAGPDAPHGAQGPDGVHRITLDVTLLGSGRLDSFKGTFHAAVACLMAHLSPPSRTYSLSSPRIKVHGVEVTVSSSDFYQHFNFFNCIKVFNEDEKILRKHSK